MNMKTLQNRHLGLKIHNPKLLVIGPLLDAYKKKESGLLYAHVRLQVDFFLICLWLP